MTARGALGALIAFSAGVSLLPQWAALALGAAVGTSVPLVQYVVDHVLRLDDPTSAIAMHGIPSLAGLLVLGALDQRAQLQAQLTGSITALLVAFIPSWLLFAAVQGITHGWQEGYVLRLPRLSRSRRRARARRRQAKRGRIAVPAANDSAPGSQVAAQLPGEEVSEIAAHPSNAWIEQLRAWARGAYASTEPIRTWPRRAYGWVVARLRPQAQASVVDADQGPGSGTSSEETNAPQLESGG